MLYWKRLYLRVFSINEKKRFHFSPLKENHSDVNIIRMNGKVLNLFHCRKREEVSIRKDGSTWKTFAFTGPSNLFASLFSFEDSPPASKQLQYIIETNRRQTRTTTTTNDRQVNVDKIMSTLFKQFNSLQAIGFFCSLKSLLLMFVIKQTTKKERRRDFN